MTDLRKIFALWLICMTAASLHVSAQDIEIKDFRRNYTSLKASMNAVYDNAGTACALIRFSVRDTSFIIESNMGVVKRINQPGEIQIYVPKGTKRITVRYKGMLPLRDYEIPEAIEPKVTYDAVLSATNEAIKRQNANKGHNIYVGAGYQVMSISGPSVSLGFKIDHHVVEIGAVIGLAKTDDLYFYQKSDNTLKAAWNYKAIRTMLRYGYDMEMTDFLSIMPQAGVALNAFTGSEAGETKTNSNYFKQASSVSALAALRFTLSFSNNIKLNITPEFHFGIVKSNNCKLISENDNTFKKWTDGINLNMGLIFFF